MLLPVTGLHRATSQDSPQETPTPHLHPQATTNLLRRGIHTQSAPFICRID